MPDLTFSQVIEEDHKSINRCAKRLKNAQTLEEKTQLREELVWRLIRHDVSEELVMRPAFYQSLGAEGQAMNEKDRNDHQKAKEQLHTLSSLSFDAPEFVPFIEALLAELMEHMKQESGKFIPKLERSLSKEDTLRLAREYETTQLITPMLCLPRARNGGGEQPPGSGEERKCFENVDAYTRTSMDRFREIHHILMSEGSSDTSTPKALLRSSNRL